MDNLQIMGKLQDRVAPLIMLTFTRFVSGRTILLFSPAQGVRHH